MDAGQFIIIIKHPTHTLYQKEDHALGEQRWVRMLQQPIEKLFDKMFVHS
jgi:hypothetical protein